MCILLCVLIKLPSIWNIHSFCYHLPKCNIKNKEKPTHLFKADYSLLKLLDCYISLSYTITNIVFYTISRTFIYFEFSNIHKYICVFMCNVHLTVTRGHWILCSWNKGDFVLSVIRGGN